MDRFLLFVSSRRRRRRSREIPILTRAAVFPVDCFGLELTDATDDYLSKRQFAEFTTQLMTFCRSQGFLGSIRLHFNVEVVKAQVDRGEFNSITFTSSKITVRIRLNWSRGRLEQY